MAVKIVRQENQLAVLGAPVSAAGLAPGSEGSPSALRNAGLISRLESVGYKVADLGDDPPRPFQQDDESPRARNLPNVLAALEALRPRVEIAVKSGALPIILAGNCSMALATVAGLRRYFRHVGMLYLDADADLQTPATTDTGSLEGMVVSHLAGRGASELVRFWGEPPLVREPDLALFGVSRMEAAEEKTLQTSPVRRYLAEDIKRKGAAAKAKEAVERIHGNAHPFVLHIDADVIAEFSATDMPSPEGLRLEEVREAFEIFAGEKHLAAIEVAGYNPQRDPDGACAKVLIELLAGALAARREKVQSLAAAASAGVSAPEAAAPAVPEAQVTMGEAWSSDTLDSTEPAGDSTSADAGNSEEPQS